MDFSDLKRKLEALYDPEEQDRSLKVLSVINQALDRTPYTSRPVLVGGAAVEYYTAGLYATQDIDALLMTPNEYVDLVMSGLGFQKDGKNWVHPGLNLLVEFPGNNAYDPFLAIDTIHVDGVNVKISSLESMILDRLESFAFNGYPRDGIGLLGLVAARENFELDREWLEQAIREKDEDLMPLYQRVLQFEGEVDWQTPPPQEHLYEQLKDLWRHREH